MEINGAAGGYRLREYRESPVPAALRPLLEVTWCWRSHGSADAGADIHRVLPETGVSLALFARRAPDGGVEPESVVFMGPIRTPRLFRPAVGLHIEGVRIKVEWCRDILGLDPAELADGMLPAPAAVGRVLPGLEDGLLRVRRAGEATVVLLDALLAAWERNERSREARYAHRALEAVRSSPDVSPAAAVSDIHLEASPRHMRRLVRRATGSGLKRFQRVRRLHRAVSTLTSDGQTTPSALAVRSGYSDQAHFIRECRSLAGVTPEVLRRERS